MQTATETHLQRWVDSFIVSKQAQGVTKGTVSIYQDKLRPFTEYCKRQGLDRVEQVTAVAVRQYLLQLGETQNSGGVHVHFRVLKTLLLWYELEEEPEDWRNPIKRVRAPRVPVEPIQGVTPEQVRQLVDNCETETFASDRDAAIVLGLFDTGARAMEFSNHNLADVDMETGRVLIRRGKGRKPRHVFLGRGSMAALGRYLEHRTDDLPALWVVNPCYGSRQLSQAGLGELLERLCERSGIPNQSPHD